MKIRAMFYRRLPDKITRFPIVVLYEEPEYIVTINLLNPSKPLKFKGSILLDKGYLGIWFCPTDGLHDVSTICDPSKILAS